MERKGFWTAGKKALFVAALAFITFVIIEIITSKVAIAQALFISVLAGLGVLWNEKQIQKSSE